MKQIMFLLHVSVFIYGCSTFVHRELYIKGLPPKPEDHPIKLYEGELLPECTYEKIAHIDITQSPTGNREAVWAQLKREARNFGGDAVIGIDKRLVGFGDPRSMKKSEMQLQIMGDVIRFTEPCDEK